MPHARGNRRSGTQWGHIRGRVHDANSGRTESLSWQQDPRPREGASALGHATAAGLPAGCVTHRVLPAHLRSGEGDPHRFRGSSSRGDPGKADSRAEDCHVELSQLVPSGHHRETRADKRAVWGKGPSGVGQAMWPPRGGR